jgi:hypothetical protein
MSDTPMTDAEWDSIIVSHPWDAAAEQMAQHARKLERELADAKRELDNATSDAKQSEVDAIRALHERNEAREQRDRLAEALERIDYALSTAEDVMHGAGADDVTMARRIIIEALAAVKGGTP